jgi:hypothetical protein
MYFDIDSTYRDRTNNPNPADFVVLPSNSSDNTNSGGTSNETTIFPPFSTPPLAFYYENLVSPTTTLDEINERTNLPFMYATNNSNVYQLDEFVLASTDFTTTESTFNPAYPRGVIPLGEANEYYTGDTLENFTTNECRQITSFTYDATVTNSIFQICTVQWTSVLNGVTTIAVNTISATTIPVSNIDRYYQGKYILTSNGERRLIVNYTVYDGYAVFLIQTAFTTNPGAGESISIVSDKKWYATVNTPFSTPIPNYPSYRIPLPSSTFQFNKYTLYSSTDALTRVHLNPSSNSLFIHFMEDTEVKDGDNLELGNVKYGFSSDSLGTVWGDVSNNNAIFSAPIVGDSGSALQTNGDTLLVAMESASSQMTVSVNQDNALGAPNQNNTLLFYEFTSSGTLEVDSSLYNRDLSVGAFSYYSSFLGENALALNASSTAEYSSCSFASEIFDITNMIIQFDLAIANAGAAVQTLVLVNAITGPTTGPNLDRLIIYFTVSTSTLVFEWKLNGVTVVSATYVNAAIKDGSWHNFQFSFGTTGIAFLFDRVIVSPTYGTGTSSNTICLASFTNTPQQIQIFATTLAIVSVAVYYLDNFQIASYTYIPVISSYMFPSSNITLDASGNGLTPTVTGTPLTLSFSEGRVSSIGADTGADYFDLNWNSYISSFSSLINFSYSLLFRIGDGDGISLFVGTVGSQQLTITITNSLVSFTSSLLFSYEYLNDFNDGLFHNIIITTGTSGNKLYIDGVQVTPVYTTGTAAVTNSLAYLNGLNAIDDIRLFVESECAIDSLYFLNTSVISSALLSQLSGEVATASRWSQSANSFTSSWTRLNPFYFYNFDPSFPTAYISNTKTIANSVYSFTACVFVDDDPSFPLQRIIVGNATLASPSFPSTTSITQTITTGTCFTNTIGVHNDKVFIYWTVYISYRNELNYYFSIATATDGTDLFDSIVQVASISVPSFPLNTYSLSMVSTSATDLYCVLVNYTSPFYLYSLYRSTDSGATWAFVNSLPVSLGTSLSSSYYIVQMLVYSSPSIAFFINDSINRFTYTNTVDGGVTFSSLVSIDTSDAVSSISPLLNSSESPSLIQLAYTLQNSNGTYSVILFSQQQFEIAEAVPYRIRRNPPQISGRAQTNPITAATTFSVTFTTASIINNIYNNMYIWLYNDNVGSLPSAAPFEMINQTYLITAYNGATKTATVLSALPDLSVISLLPNTNLLNWEILGDSSTFGTSGIDYTGNILLSERCYDMFLSHIILPNATLSTSLGNQVSFYPYIYVKFTSVEATLQHAFFSNNPNATSVTFKVPVSQFTNDPSALPYIRLSGDNSAQIRMDISKGFRFTVILPNGEIFTTLQTDNMPPDSPNPLLQISAGVTFKSSV